MFHRILTGLALCGICAAQCSLQTVRGAWVSYGQMTVMMDPTGSGQPVPVPFAGLTVAKVDYQGRISGSGTSVIGGRAVAADLSGSIQVNPDCTGTVAFTSKPAGAPAATSQETARVVVTADGNEMRGMLTQSTVGQPAGVVYWRRISWGDPQCTSDMVRGVYAATMEGILLMTQPGQSQPLPAPFSALGAASVDYQGRWTGAATFSVAGTIADFSLLNTSTTVNADCTGTVRWRIGPKGSSQAMPGQGIDQVVVLNNGDEMVALTTQGVLGAPVMIGKYKRISTVPASPSW